MYCDLLIWRCRSLLFSCNPRLREYVGASFRYCDFAFQFLFRPVAMKVRFSYVQFRSPPNTSWKATYKLFPIFGPYMVSWTTLSYRVLSTRSSSAATTLLLLLSLLSFTHDLKLSSTITLSALTLCRTFLALASLWNPSPYSLLFTSPQTSPLYATFECAFFSDSFTQNVMSRQCSLAEFIRQTLLSTNLLIHSGSVSKFNCLVLTWS